MDPLHQKLKALKPDEPDDEIAKDLVAIRQARPGIKDEEIMAQAEKLVQGGGKVQPLGVQPRPVDPVASSATSRMAPEIPAEPMIEAPAAPTPDLPEDDLNKPESFGHKAATVALQGLAGLGDAISGSYGGVKTDFLKQAQGAEASEIAKRTAVSEELRKRRGEKRDDRKLDIESAKAQLEAMKKGGKDTFEMEEKLRDGFTGQAKTFMTVRDQYGVVQAAAKDPDAVGDMALIFAYMKLVDPGSTVREGEFANAQNAAGVPDRVVNMYNRAKNGERFNPSVRKDFVDRSENLYKSYEGTFNRTKSQYDALASGYGLNPKNVTDIVVGEPSKSTEGKSAPASAPTVTSKEQFDALPSGSEFIDSEGKRRRKK